MNPSNDSDHRLAARWIENALPRLRCEIAIVPAGRRRQTLGSILLLKDSVVRELVQKGFRLQPQGFTLGHQPAHQVESRVVIL